MFWQKIHHYFIPHKETHEKAKLISWEGLLIYVLLFILLQVGFSSLGFAKPGVLGITGNIDQKRLIELTNQERAKKGLTPVTENQALDKAATLKAQNMFAENYWAHFAPSGKTPWDFILGSGYNFTFAGENLAKNFYSSEDVVSAWMASQTHRDNLLNSKYKDIGIAVVDGTLNGQKTTLIVQMFGSVQGVTSQPIVNVSGNQVSIPKESFQNTTQLSVALQPNLQNSPLVDPYKVVKTSGLAVIFILATLLALDLIIISRRGVFRISSNHIAHMTILGITAATLISSTPGSIL